MSFKWMAINMLFGALLGALVTARAYSKQIDWWSVKERTTWNERNACEAAFEAHLRSHR